MSEATTLARAATVLRERAKAATQGPWSASSRNYASLTAPGQYGRAEDLAAYGGKLVGESMTSSDRRYLATISPDTALVLADLLDRIAESHIPEKSSPDSPLNHAVALAQAILRPVDHDG